MDTSIILEMINPYVFLGCVMLGFLIKLWVGLDWVNNKLIPTILAVVGCVSYYCIYTSIEKAMIGAFVGVMATGGFELVRNLITLVSEKVDSKEI